MKFQDFVGNEEALEQVETAVSTGDIAHATLILGPRGVGKKYLGRLLAQSIFCEGDEPPCGQCEPCKFLTAGAVFGENHPDYVEVEPEGPSIKKSVIEDMIYRAQTKPYSGSVKVFLIDEFDRVTKEGQNALLKTLEEPLPGVYFILLSTFEDKILPTIHSRCRIIHCYPLTEETIKEALVYRGVDPTIAQRAAFLSGGSFSRALIHSGDQVKSKQRDEMLSAFYSAAVKGDFAAFRAWQTVEKYLDNLDEIFYLLESWSRDLMVYYLTKDPQRIHHRDREKEIEKTVDKIQEKSLTIYEEVLKTREYIEANGNKQLLFEALFLYIGG